ncbi:CAP domain-containing protein [Pseudanabaena sp. ABRG5-3]|uniref:CAP domain-containing protein n=1 Tax=Pseudanabaena sp. ABRG5-3 TaxID=685565 RepID=UPI000DC738A4|nr:CAP domain-containing protein [Pseudanabaena sp. ABRG5-3]BBC22928.1 SCP-like extracellular protein [Pseudanabaena sp. ABRG5-3]
MPTIPAIAAEFHLPSRFQQQFLQFPSTTKVSQGISNSNSNFETELLRLTNLERKKAGLSPLKLSLRLASTAQFHAVDMANNNYFSHTGCNGSSVGDRAKANGYKYQIVAENIAAGRSTPEGTIRQWMNSSGHRANILNPQFTEIGFGYANTSNSRYRHYWVQILGTPQR